MRIRHACHGVHYVIQENSIAYDGSHQSGALLPPSHGLGRESRDQLFGVCSGIAEQSFLDRSTLCNRRTGISDGQSTAAVVQLCWVTAMTHLRPSGS